MSIYGALRVGVAGLNAQSQAVATASDNIANVNTTGFKASRARFSTLVTASSGTGSFSPGGVQTIIRNEISGQGLITNTNVATDIAVQGNGFFTVTDKLTRNATTGKYEIGGNVFFSRAGEFRPDSAGNLVNPQGYYLVGWPANSTNTDFVRTNVHSKLLGLNVANQTTTPIPTTGIFVSANLNAQGTISDSFDITTQLLDRQGSQRSLQLVFKKSTEANPGGAGTIAQSNSWLVTAQIIGETAYQGGIIIRNADDPTNAANNTSTNALGQNLKSAATGATPTANTAGQAALAGNSNLADWAALNVAGSAIQTVTSAANVVTNTNTTDGSVSNPVPIAVVKFSSNGTLSSVEAIDGVGLGGLASPISRLYSLNKDANGLPALWQTSVPVNANAALNTGVTIFTSVDSDATESNTQAFAQGVAGIDDNVPVTISFGTLGQTDGLSQFDGANTINYFTQNGRSFGSLSAVTFDKNGIATAQFDNGDTRKIYQVPITTFSNPNGLLSFSGNVYGETGTSGSAIAHIAGTGGAGKISPSSLEASTVDLATEFTELIIAQKNYSANTKSITTADQLLEQLVQLIR